MRVALNGFFLDQPRTGSGQYLSHLWKGLYELAGRQDSGAGHARFTMLVPPGVQPGEELPTNPRFRLARIPQHGVLAGKSENVDKLVWEQWAVSKAAKTHGAQLLHSPYLTAPLRRRLPVVVTAHDMIPWVVPGYRSSLAVRLYLAVSAQGVKRARLILADSDASRRDVIRVLKVSPGKVRTVYLGVEPQPRYSAQQLDEARTRYGLPQRFAFYIGGFDRRKNVPLLLRAWRRAASELRNMESAWCEDSTPVLAIGGAVPEPGGVFPDVRGEARALGLGGASGPVRLVGRVSERDKAMLMAAAHVFVYPSSYEGFGLDPLEAMSVGCPVVSSSGGSLAEVVGAGGLLVPPDDEAALCKAIVAAWSNEGLRKDLSESGKLQASRFTWQRTAEQTCNAYRLALKGAA